MVSIILDDQQYAAALFPFAEIRSVADIRIGILTIREKWEKILGCPVKTLAEAGDTATSIEHRRIPANLVPSPKWAKEFLAGNADPASPDPDGFRTINHPWEINIHNDWALRKDFELLARGKNSHPIPETVQCVGVADIFIEEGAKLEFCILNALTGPIYIGKNAQVMEGASIRGPFAIGENGVVKMGTRIYGASTIGHDSVVGGELKNVVLFGNSNKGHDGYLGDSVIGEWCNLGAGTSNSNVKNNAGPVKAWSKEKNDWIDAGQKCGLMLGDYSRAAINTAFNTGSVIGICANIFSAGLVPKFVDSFSWGTENPGNYKFDKAIEHISNWKNFKKQRLSTDEIQTLQHIFDKTTGSTSL